MSSTSTPSPYTTLSEDTDAVLKLHLGEKRGTRRIAFRRLWDSESCNVSYHRLADLAVQYSILSAQQNELAKTRIKRQFGEENATVNVTYIDEDGDTIIISSDEELAEAFHQFLSKVPPVRVVRASAKVRGLNAAKKRISSVSVETRSLVDTDSSIEKAKDVDAVLMDSAPKVTNLPEDAVEITPHQSSSCQSFPSDGFRKVDAPENAPATTNDFTPCVSTIAAPPVSAPPVPPSPPKAVPEVPRPKIQIPKSYSPDFIHGRHTCDGCYTTPIIGYRYNAVNLPDYDLCQKCFDCYNGSMIIFAADQLQRDEHHQQRWKSRFMQKCLDETRRTCQKSPRSTKSSRMSDSPNKVGQQSKKDHSCKDASAARVSTAKKVKTGADFESASDELNTLLDSRSACPKKVDEALRTFEETQREIFGGEKLHSNPPSQGSMDTRTNGNATTQVNGCSNLDPASTRPPFQSFDRRHSPFTQKRDGDNDDGHQAPSKTLREYFDKVMENLSEEVRAELGGAAAATSATMNGVTEKQVSKFLGHLTEELKASLRSFPTEKATSVETTKVDVEINTKPEEKVGSESVGADPEKDEEVEPEAQAMRTGKSTINEPEIVIEPTVELPIDTLVMDTTEPQPESQLPSVASRGEMIIDGKDDFAVEEDNDTHSIVSGSDEKSQSSGNSGWEVVNDNSVVTDEMMAQAAQMLGSALFQSDINVASTGDTETSASAPVISDSVCSAITSVPTITDSSEISSTLLNRWEDELRQLHELGFLDDRANVEAFGHLEAANMGVNSDDKVTVAHVVNYLLNKE